MDMTEWISHKKNQEAYTEWLNSPVTKAIIDGLSGGALLRISDMATGEDALKTVGFLAGKEYVLATMRNLLDLVSSKLGEEEQSRTLVARLMADGYSRKDALRIIKNEKGIAL